MEPNFQARELASSETQIDQPTQPEQTVVENGCDSMIETISPTNYWGDEDTYYGAK